MKRRHLIAVFAVAIGCRDGSDVYNRPLLDAAPDVGPGLHSCENKKTRATVSFDAANATIALDSNGPLIGATDTAGMKISIRSRRGWTCDWEYPRLVPAP